MQKPEICPNFMTSHTVINAEVRVDPRLEKWALGHCYLATVTLAPGYRLYWKGFRTWHKQSSDAFLLATLIDLREFGEMTPRCVWKLQQRVSPPVCGPRSPQSWRVYHISITWKSHVYIWYYSLSRISWRSPAIFWLVSNWKNRSNKHTWE